MERNQNIKNTTIGIQLGLMNKQKGVIILPVLFLFIILGVVGYLLYQNYFPKKSVITPQPTQTEKPKEKSGETVELNQSPIVSKPLDTSSWKSFSFALSRYDPYTEKFSEFDLVFKIPSGWKVEEKNKKDITITNSSYKTADYIVSNSENTLTINFNAVNQGQANWYPLPTDAILVATYVPNPSGGAARAWIVRYTPNKNDLTNIRYAEAYTNNKNDKLTINNEISYWLNAITNPLDGHKSGKTFTIEMTYSGSDNNYTANIAAADQIVNLLVAINRN